MLVIPVKYKDISYEQFLQCLTPEYRKIGNADYWELLRGKQVLIETPEANLPDMGHFICSGPLFKVHGIPPREINGRRYTVCVCPHIAEIGD